MAELTEAEALEDLRKASRMFGVLETGRDTSQTREWLTAECAYREAVRRALRRELGLLREAS